MVRTSVSKLIPFTILPVAVFSVQMFTRLPIGNTAMWWMIQFGIIVLFFWEARFGLYKLKDLKLILFVKLYLLWNLISIGRGIFFAENYWHYKNLVGMGLTLLLPVLVYITLNNRLVQDILAFFIKYTLPFALLVFPFTPTGAWGWYLFPVSLLMLFFPALSMRNKLLLLFISAVAILGDLTTRSFLIKYSVPLFLVIGFFYMRFFKLSGVIMEFTRILLIAAPIVFFVLGVTGKFLIFNMGDYIKGDYKASTVNTSGEAVEADLTGDTRTFLYVEVMESAFKYDYWLLGRTPARGNETKWFKTEMTRLYGSPERMRNEVGILNIFTWTGIVGVVLYFLILFQASFLAVNRSNNIYAKILGIFIAFRWAYGWVEDYQAFDANNFVLWLAIGLCLSSSFRAMTDIEVKLWLWGIFKKEYSWVYRYYVHGVTY
ncbi:hypothetical protein [Maribellus maritimus]|uniref:hypothetical protein n=1 Tax=Maribellus maritimus TaxID=2870838 RepID=UPI001EEC4712|nr:hypothetical protein [Maribellus maritimus]MCG6190243.1 hypothetical protein [Maribellus maritimus]